MSLRDILDAPVRRMGTLIRWLPPEAAVWADTPAGWTIERELAAATVELLGEAVRGLSAQVARRRSDIPRSIRIPRPINRDAPSPAKRFDPVAFTAWLSLASGGERT
jgi:hypothetical protein